MLLTKIKIVAAFVMTASMIALGTVWMAAALPAGQADEKRAPAKKPEAKKAQKPKTDLERIQGIWKPILSQSWGQESSKEHLGKGEKRYLIKGNNLVSRSKHQMLEGILKLDPSANPKTIDLMFGEGFKVWTGIYAFEGDNLKICVAYGSRPRPLKFSAGKEDGGDWIEILERQPSDETPPEKEDRGNKEKEARLKINGNLSVLGGAMHRYHDEYGHFPRAAIANKEGKALLSWRVALLPFLGLEELYKEFKLDESWDSAHNKRLLAKMPKVYAVPEGAKKVPDSTYFQVFVGKDTVFEEGKDIQFQDITDGTSSTILIIEAGKAIPWTKPEDLPYSPDKPIPELGGAIGDGLVSLVLADGSGHLLRRGVGNDFTQNLRAFITRNGGEIVSEWKDLDP
jgi:uncharacterized protein (TIGR03067 family)